MQPENTCRLGWWNCLRQSCGQMWLRFPSGVVVGILYPRLSEGEIWMMCSWGGIVAYQCQDQCVPECLWKITWVPVPVFCMCICRNIPQYTGACRKEKPKGGQKRKMVCLDLPELIVQEWLSVRWLVITIYCTVPVPGSWISESFSKIRRDLVAWACKSVGDGWGRGCGTCVNDRWYVYRQHYSGISHKHHSPFHGSPFSQTRSASAASVPQPVPVSTTTVVSTLVRMYP